MLARRDDDAELRAGIDVDVRVDAALADEPELSQPFQQRGADLGSLADQHEHFRVLQAFGQRIDVLHVIVPDSDLMSGKPGETVQRAERIEVVIENGDVHLAIQQR